MGDFGYPSRSPLVRMVLAGTNTGRFKSTYVKSTFKSTSKSFGSILTSCRMTHYVPKS